MMSKTKHEPALFFLLNKRLNNIYELLNEPQRCYGEPFTQIRSFYES